MCIPIFLDIVFIVLCPMAETRGKALDGKLSLQRGSLC